MEFQELTEREQDRAAALRPEVAEWTGAAPEDVSLVRSPYRVCPLGAHVDHQLGEVTGMALDMSLLLGFSPQDDAVVQVRSHQFPGTASVSLTAPQTEPTGDWADYLRGAVHALRRDHDLRVGFRGIVDGYENVGGLSSSAAAGVAYLLALEKANGLSVTDEANIELDRRIENDYIGLNNGILDQSSILLSRPRHLMHLDCQTGQSRLIPFGGKHEFSVAVLFSGLRFPLSDSDYNRRVAECREAARRLLEAAGMEVPTVPVLRAVPPEAFDHYGEQLPEPLRRRAAHYFGEQERVHRGLELWRDGDLEAFGGLMDESGRSSVENYECGNDYLRTAFRVLRECSGVYGARFSGAGFRGCCIGLARPESEPRIAEQALREYLEEHPDMEGEAEVYFCRSAAGAALVE
ncbi:MAG: galactokinase family protein [Candidatus Brocadiia bacterium]